MTNHSSTPQERAIVRRQLDQQLSQQDSGGIARYQQGQQGPIQVHIVQHPQPQQESHRGPSAYQTMQSRGEPEQLPSMRLPGLLQLTMSPHHHHAIHLLSVHALHSAYELRNSQDRIHNNRAPIHVR